MGRVREYWKEGGGGGKKGRGRSDGTKEGNILYRTRKPRSKGNLYGESRLLTREGRSGCELKQQARRGGKKREERKRNFFGNWAVKQHQ